MGLEFFLGIDESNHGKYPESIVAVYSHFPSDITRTVGLSKRRGKKPIESFIEKRDFHYFEITEAYKQRIGDYRNARIIALSELIKSFNVLEKVYIDGDLDSAVIEELERILYPASKPKIIPVPQGDTTIPLLNIADALANILYRHSVSRNNTVLYPDKRITEPSLQDYARLLGR